MSFAKINAWKNKKISGFTVLELLIVIAIIGILSSVALTSLSEARIKAKNARIDAHVREYALALHSFIANNGRLPYMVDCQPTGIPVVGNGGTLGVCLGNYPDEGMGEGCGFYLKSQGSYSTFEDPLLSSQIFEEIGVLPPLEPIPLDLIPQHEPLLDNHIRGALYSCSDYNPDGSVNEATIRYFKIGVNQECLGGATYDNSFDIFGVSSCLLPIKA